MLHLGTAKRKKLWDINTGWHCSIIGTCLTTEDLRALARKLHVQTHQDDSTDFRLHGHFVQACSQGGTTAKLLQKLLDRRHSAAVRRFAKADGPESLEEIWNTERKGRDIPGAYWALMSHPHIETGLGTRAYGHIHMLSHLVGASNRADLDTLRSLETEVRTLSQRLESETARHARRMEDKDREIANLERQLVAARSARVNFQAAASAPAPANLNGEPDPDQTRRLQESAHEMAKDLEKTHRRNEELEEAVSSLRGEVRALESALLRTVHSEETGETDLCGGVGDCPFDLNGRCILYVGGRLANVHRLRELVAQWNGELLHHDGGMEQSLDELPSCVVRADAVVFPTDCISHSAALKAKRLCRQSMKPYVPLRGSGVSSFVAGLREKIGDLGPRDPGLAAAE
ncbi:DUF2325 domain-containing protein [Hwanghaeella sp.]|uniref:DUF2325 domain-containing protein n=1 Tax=Hwanghaeella sp. TaxID=2605943 RepID=UPI003CCBEFEC